MPSDVIVILTFADFPCGLVVWQGNRCKRLWWIPKAVLNIQQFILINNVNNFLYELRGGLCVVADFIQAKPNSWTDSELWLDGSYMAFYDDTGVKKIQGELSTLRAGTANLCTPSLRVYLLAFGVMRRNEIQNRTNVIQPRSTWRQLQIKHII